MYVGIDLGGTAIKLALVSDEGELLFKLEEKTKVSEGGDHILSQMDNMINKSLTSLHLHRDQVYGIGIGVPAFLDHERGFVHRAVNLGWENYPLKEKLESITKLPVSVDNDANMAALGEMWKGSGQGATELLCITLGTGIGGGIIVKGSIHHGLNGAAGEIGHVTVLPEGGFQCNCGKTGCIETIASATGISRLAVNAIQGLANAPYVGSDSLEAEAWPEETIKASPLWHTYEQHGKIEAKDVAKAADEQDPIARGIFKLIAHDLGLVLGNYAMILNPGKIVIGGGVARAGEVLFAPLRQSYQYYALSELTGDIPVLPAVLGNDAGVIGAAWLAQHQP